MGSGLGPHLTPQVAWAEAYLRAKYHLDPSSRLATINMGRKFGGGLRPLFWGGGEGSPSNTKSQRAEAYLRAKWNLDLCSHLAATDLGRKLGAVPLWGGGDGSPSKTLWPGPRPTCKPSFILIRQAVWPQYTNVTDRQTGQTDRQTTVR